MPSSVLCVHPTNIKLEYSYHNYVGKTKNTKPEAHISLFHSPGNKWSICMTQIDIQPSNMCPIATSQTSVPQIYVLFSHSQIGIQFSNLWLFLTFSNPRPMTSLMYALTQTNKSAIDLRIWKRYRFENTLKSDHDLR